LSIETVGQSQLKKLKKRTWALTIEVGDWKEDLLQNDEDQV
jgi:hypothetical protein